MLLRRRRGEAPLPLILAGAASLTAILVIVGGLLTRKSDSPVAAQPGTKYIQSLEGAMESYDRKPRATARGSEPERIVATSKGAGPATLAATALHQKMMALVAAPDVLIRRLGHRDGDFVFSKQRGWLKFDPSLNALRPITHGELPQDLKDRYPAELYPSRGKTGRGPDEERAGQPSDSTLAGGRGRGGTRGGGSDGSGGNGSSGAGGAGGAGGTDGSGGASGAGSGPLVSGGPGSAVPLAGVGDEVLFRETPLLAPAPATP